MTGTVLVTGASGFVGQHWLAASGNRERARCLSLRAQSIDGVNWNQVETVVHLAGIAHRMDASSGNIYYEVNRDLTVQLARAAKHHGVKHFVFISSVKVYGDAPIHIDRETHLLPDDDYGKSKLEAERALQELQEAQFCISIIRPPLIYGSKVKGNLSRLLNLLKSGAPLPFGNIHNQRSMVFVGNLVALIDRVIELRKPGVFFAGDVAPLSTTELLQLMYFGLGRRPRLFSLPIVLRGVLRARKPALHRRLFESYTVDICSTNSELAFAPPFSSAFGIASMARWHHESGGPPK